MVQGHSGKGNLASYEIPPKSIGPKVAEETWVSETEDGRRNTEDIDEQPPSLSVSQPTKLYAQMIPPLTVNKTSLPPRPNFDLNLSGRHICGSHTTHQLLLVLNYLFISSMLPTDVGALWKVICRRDRDWKKSFVLQRSQLQPWLVSARKALTNSDGLHTISLEDIELQTRYILFILSHEASPDSSFLVEIFQNEYPPYRPFGVRASIALICHAFEGIQADEIEGYESKEIWSRDQNFLSTMAFRLGKSPLFGSGVSMRHLQSMILSVQKAFQCEEIRVSSMEPLTLSIESQAGALEYYRRAFLTFDPMLLPKILASMSEVEGTFIPFEQNQLCNMERNLDRKSMAFRLAHNFSSLTPERLDAAFQTIHEIQQSKADKIVAIEMFHVKSFEEAYKSNKIGPTTVRVFHVPP
ncbi:hypothetical protein N7475_000173 [Penicillium sp. IBT 31633x]|nr:hypothetical protein N7475_000173 [Penicillium sp. IBT 31633x]